MSFYWNDLGSGPALLEAPGAKVVLLAGRDGRLKTRDPKSGLLVDLDLCRHPIAARIVQALNSTEDLSTAGKCLARRSRGTPCDGEYVERARIRPTCEPGSGGSSSPGSRG